MNFLKIFLRKQRTLISAVLIFIFKNIPKEKQDVTFYFFISKVSPHNGNIFKLIYESPKKTNENLTIKDFENKILIPFLKSNHPTYRKRTIKFLRLLSQSYTSNGYSNLAYSVSKCLVNHLENLEEEFKTKEYTLYQFQEIRKMGQFTEANAQNLLQLTKSLTANDSIDLIYNTLFSSIKYHYEISDSSKSLIKIHKELKKFEEKLLLEASEKQLSKIYSLLIHINEHKVFNKLLTAEERKKYSDFILSPEKEDHPILDQENFKIKEIEKTLKSNFINFIDYISKAQSLAIVGNSPIELQKKNGKLIDSHEVIFRFNNFNTSSNFQEDYGKKTNILVHSGATNVKIQKNSNFDFLLLSGFDLLFKDKKVKFIEELMKQGHNVVLFPDQIWRRALIDIGSTPSAGYLTLMLIKEYWNNSLHENNIFGFSFKSNKENFFNSNYHNKSESYSKHNWNKEKKILSKIFMS